MEILTTNLTKYDDETSVFIEDAMVKAGEYYIKTIPVVVELEIGKHWLH